MILPPDPTRAERWNGPAPPHRMDLLALGWNPARAADLDRLRSLGLQPARIAVEDKHHYSVLADHADYIASISGKLLHGTPDRSELPKVGDWVGIELLPDPDRALIHEVLPRQTRLARKVAGRTIEEQVLAANIDIAFITQAVDASFNLRRLERFLIMVHEGGVQPVILLNKIDLSPNPEPIIEQSRQISGNTPVIPISALTGDGLDRLAALIQPAQTVVFIGPSGVGKSTLINRLAGEEIQATVEVRESDAKGRHTTTWRELICLPNGGLVIDTPGMREFHMWVAQEGMNEAFADIETLAEGCRFRDCSHSVEKDCAVQQAVADGVLTPQRHQSYLKLKRELAYIAEERQRHTYINRRRARSQSKSGPRSRTNNPRPHQDPDEA